MQVTPIQVPVVFAQQVQLVPQPIMAQQEQPPAQQPPAAPAPAPAAQAAPAAATTDKLRGTPPEIFKGDR